MFRYWIFDAVPAVVLPEFFFERKFRFGFDAILKNNKHDMLEIVDFNENHYSVRQKIGDAGSKSMRNIFPLHPVTSKPPESPYGAKQKLAENPVFQFFALMAKKGHTRRGHGSPA